MVTCLNVEALLYTAFYNIHPIQEIWCFQRQYCIKSNIAFYKSKKNEVLIRLAWREGWEEFDSPIMYIFLGQNSIMHFDLSTNKSLGEV